MVHIDKNKKYLSTSSEWTFELIEKYDKEIARIAHDKFKLDTYPNQIEVISAEQMIDAYSSVGMPVGYHHWSFGKHFVNTEKQYKRGRMGLAFEIVINSNPCIAYLMEENTMTMQAVVIAHACYGHNSFFKNNYLFKTWTSPDSIIDYLLFAKNYISKCEEKYGSEVELLLDSCHALMDFGVDRYKRPDKLSLIEEQKKQKEREEYLQLQVNDLWRTIPISDEIKSKEKNLYKFPKEPEENLLYFFEKNAPLLKPWQREIIRIVRKIAQYFYPQKQTKVMNEGWATFWHYTIMNELYNEDLITNGSYLEFIKTHTDVISQPGFDSKFYSGVNPYALGFNIYSDIKRICEEPTDEDKKYFSEIAGSNYLETLDFAMRNFKDESFIRQFLSPKLIRDFKLFSILDDENNKELIVEAIHDEDGYINIRESLAEQYNLSNIEPNIQVYSVNREGDRAITLRHIMHDDRPLNDETQEVLKHIHRIWGFDVILESFDPKDNLVKKNYRCPDIKK